MKREKANRLRAAAVFALILCAVLCGCQPKEEKNPAEVVVTQMRSGLIKDIYVNKARFAPDEKALLTVEILGEENADLELNVRVRRLTTTVFEKTQPVSIKAGEKLDAAVELELPEEDFQGYSVEAYLLKDGKPVDWEMTAAEVASDWSRFPRYGYLTKYGYQSDEKIQQILDRLNKYHITGLFYYDVLDSHQKPLAGTVESPDSGWKTLSSSYADRETVSKLIDYGHEYNMNSYIYNLIFGAYDNFRDYGISEEWGVFKDRNHQNQDYHGDFIDAWETQRLYLFNPANRNWQDYYLQATKDVLSVYKYDGLQIDSLGERGTLYDYNGNEIDFKSTYSSLLTRLRNELNTRVIFNAVSGYGQKEVMREVDYDIVYEEIWPSDARSYDALKARVESILEEKDPQKGAVIAAYMNYEKKSGAFNTAGVLLTNATLMASGASHLEIGDTGMLRSEYYPGKTLRINEELEAALRNYYSFMVAYENYLRDPSLKAVNAKTYINEEACAKGSTVGKIWSFSKENQAGDQMLHFINLVGVNSNEWVDKYGKQTAPEKQTNLRVEHYVSKAPAHVYLASPDSAEGIMTELPFEVREEQGETCISFEMPSLAYWNMVVLKYA